MSILAEGERSVAEGSCRAEKVCNQESSGQKSLLRLRVAVVAVVVAVLLVLGTGAAQPARAQAEAVLHSFTGYNSTDPASSDGNAPIAPLLRDSSGNLYGTTYAGGSSTNCSGGCGTVFEMVYDSSANSYTKKVLHSFSGTDGAEPTDGLVRDSSGNLYGTTYVGGSTYSSSSSPGYGIVFELSPSATSGGSWTEKVLYSFPGGTSDGFMPEAGLTRDSSGNLYGTTVYGGSSTNCGTIGCGTVFELSPPASGQAGWTEKVLHSFTSTNFTNPPASDGSGPVGGLIMDSKGNLYGTTENGGLEGEGAVFELVYDSSTTSYTEKVLYSFSFSGTDGNLPKAGLVMDSKGNLYGTTCLGGSSTYGTVFELSPPTNGSGTAWQEKVLYNFTGTDGNQPTAGLVMDSLGNLYGTTINGGSTYVSATSPGYGTVFELVPDSASPTGYSEKVLQSFTGKNGAMPYLAGVVLDSSGNLYGTTGNGGSTYTSSTSPGFGAVFGIAPVQLSASSLSFGSVAVDSTGAVQTVTITNIGGGHFSYSAAAISGTDAKDFTVTNGCSTAVAPSGTCSVTVTFMPSMASGETATLNLSQGGMTQTVSLAGTGVYPAASLSASSLTFSSQVAGSTSSAQTVTLTNNSAVPLTVKSVGITGDFAIASNTCTASVAPSGKCTVGVTFKPTAGGKLTGMLSFADNASSSPQTVALSGDGEDFTLAASTTSQSVSPGGTATYSLQLSPEGGFNQAVSLACSGAPANATCTVTPASVTLEGTNATSIQVKVSTVGSAIVAPGPGNFGPPPSSPLPEAAWLSFLGLLGLILLVKFSQNGGRVRRAAPWATLALLVALCAGCGGGSSSMGTSSANSTPAGTYTLTVKATSGSLTQTTQITLKVQ